MDKSTAPFYRHGQPHVAAPLDTPTRPTESVRLTADRAEILRALHVLCAPGDLHELRAWRGKLVRSGYFTDLDAFAAAAAKERADGVYLTLNPCTPGLLERAENRVIAAGPGKCTGDKDIIRRRWLLIDADPTRPPGSSASDAEKADAEEVARNVRAWLTKQGFPDPIFADSGNWFHLLYRVDLENTDASRDLVRRFLETLAARAPTAAVSLDRAVYNAARICKLYGTVARKGDNTPDRPHRLAHILDIPDPLTVVPRELLESVAGPPPPTAPALAPVRRAAPRLSRGVTHQAGDWRTLNVRQYVEANGGEYGRDLGNGRHTIKCPWAHEHSDARGADDSGTVIIVDGVKPTGFECRRNHCQDRTFADLRGVWPDIDRYCSAPWKPDALTPRASGADQAAAPEAGERPGIEVAGVQPRTLLQAMKRALLEGNTPPRLFAHGGKHVVKVAERPTGPEIDRLEEAALLQEVSAVADLVNRRGSYSPPPRIVLQGLLGELPESLPELQGISRIPVVRPDGSIHTAAGYDPATGRFLSPHPALIGLALPERPTRGDAAAAAGLLLDLVSEFPFEAPADRVNWLALVLTMAARPALPLCPFALFSAPIYGSGKTLLVNLAGEIAAGGPPDAENAPASDEEWEKHLLTWLGKADPIVFIDDIKFKLCSGRFASVLTSEVKSGRLLGTQTSLRLPNNKTWIVAGNNPRLSSELTQRSYRIRLLPKVPRPRLIDPATRRIRDIEEHVRQHRAELLAAVLTMIRGWNVAGQPKASESPVMGSFQRWVNWIAGVLEFAEVRGFLSNLSAHQDEADEENSEVEVFLAALLAAFSQPFSAQAVYHQARTNQAFRETVHPTLLEFIEREGTFLMRLGKILTSYEGRLVDGWRLTFHKQHSGTKQKTWRFVREATLCPKTEGTEGTEGDSALPHGMFSPGYSPTPPTVAHTHTFPCNRGGETPSVPSVLPLPQLPAGAWRVVQKWPGSLPLDGETGRSLAHTDLREYGWAHIVTSYAEEFVIVRDEHRIPEDLSELHRIPEAAAAAWLNADAPALESQPGAAGL